MKELREQIALRIRRISFGSTTVLSFLLLFVIFYINFEGCGINKVEQIQEEGKTIDAEELRKKYRFPIDFDTARIQQFYFAPTDTSDFFTSIDYNPEEDSLRLDSLPQDSLVKHQVVKTTHTDSTDAFSGTRLALDSARSPIDFIDSIPFVPEFKTKLALDVWSPRRRVPVTIRLESSTNDSVFVEVTERTGRANQWDSLTFDFSKPDSGYFNPDSISYDRIYIYFDKGAEKRNESFYWDQLELVETAKLISFEEASASQSSTAKEETPEKPQTTNEQRNVSKPVESSEDKTPPSEETNTDSDNTPEEEPIESLVFGGINGADLSGTEDNNGTMGEGQDGEAETGKTYGFGGSGNGGTLLSKGSCSPVESFNGTQIVKLKVCIDYNGNLESIRWVGGTTQDDNFVDAAKCAVRNSTFRTRGMTNKDDACGTFTFTITPGGVSF
ncbi:MAG: hypothetical protein VXY37_00685 [Bacteroidota bacterium]|nr:hypothetical protein [Bacteroidota bacterium]